MDMNTSRSDTKTCRTCMSSFSDSSQIVHLDSNESVTNSLTCREKLSLVVPEINLDAKFGSVICTDCAAALEFTYAFRKKCLETEKQVMNSASLKNQLSKDDQSTIAIANVFSLSKDAELEKLPNKTSSNNTQSNYNNNLPPVLHIAEDNGKEMIPNRVNNGSACDFTIFETLDIAYNNRVTSYRCNVCEFNIIHKLGISFHMKMHLKERSYWCNKCEVNDPLNFHLMNHIRRHKKKMRNYVGTALVSRMIMYKKQRNRETLFSCIKCDYTTQKFAELKTHTKIHKY